MAGQQSSALKDHEGPGAYVTESNQRHWTALPVEMPKGSNANPNSVPSDSRRGLVRKSWVRLPKPAPEQ